jgi:hypothetical protein
MMHWFDQKEMIRIGVSTFTFGLAQMYMSDSNGAKRFLSTCIDAGASTIWYDKDGQKRIVAGVDSDGVAGIKWTDKDGNTRIGAATRADGTANLPTTDLKPKP